MTVEFVDTNVLVYAYDRSAGPKNRRGAALMERLWSGNTGCTSIQVLQEFFVITTRKIAKPLRPERARTIIGDMGAWRVHRPSVEDVLGAIDIAEKARISFRDGMVVRSASAQGATVIWSEDLQSGGNISGVWIRNPFLDDRALNGL